MTKKNYLVLEIDGYLLFLDDETAVILINEAFLFDSIRKNFCWVEVLIHEITHYRDYKNNLGIFGHNTYDSMLSCCSFWYWTEFHARYKGTCQMLNYVNRMPIKRYNAIVLCTYLVIRLY